MPKRIAQRIQSYIELDEVITRVLCDTAPAGIVDAAYLFGETPVQEVSVFAAGLLLWKLKRVKTLAITALAGGYGYAGFKSWQNKLIKLGVPRKNVVGVPLALAPDFPPSTHAEALGLTRYATQRKWKTIFVVAPPLHHLRAFITTVSAIIRERSKLRVYSFVGIPQRWEEHIVHSQGILRGERSKLIGDELKKIERYYQKGDLVSMEKILGYLNRRDREK